MALKDFLVLFLGFKEGFDASSSLRQVGLIGGA